MKSMTYWLSIKILDYSHINTIIGRWENAVKHITMFKPKN